MKKYLTREFLRKPYIKAAYSLDGEESCIYYVPKEEASSLSYRLGALWNAEEITLLAECSAADKVTAFIEETELSASTVDGKASLTFKADGADFSLSDAEQKLALRVIFEDEGKKTEFDGILELSDYKKLFEYSETTPATEIKKNAAVNPEADFDKMDLGIDRYGSTIHLHDRFNENYDNFMHTGADFSMPNIADLSAEKRIVLDADITVNSCPLIDYSTICGFNGGYGVTFHVCCGKGEDSMIIGINKSADGLFLYCNRGFVAIDKVIHRDFGERFHLTVIWDRGDSIEALIDNEPFAKIYHPTAQRLGIYDDNSMYIGWSRCHYAPLSHEDDLDVLLENITLSSDHTETVLDKVTVEDILGESEKIDSSADGIFIAPEKLKLPNSIRNDRYALSSSVIWESSDENILSADGLFHAPETVGKNVTLRMIGVSRKYAEYRKDFNFFVKGKNPSGNALVLQNDLDPFCGVLLHDDNAVDAGSCFTSIGYDMGEPSRVNLITVESETDIGFINKNHISLFISNDNKNYSYVPHYSILKRGRKIYIYNFEESARYVKVNTTTGAVGSTNSGIRGSLQSMISAEYSTSPLLSAGQFEKETTVYAENNTDKTVFDRICVFTLDDLSITPEALKADMSDIRFMADGKTLPVYYRDGKLHVRVFEIGARSRTELRVLYGNKNAENIFDGNEVFEIQYGTKQAKQNPDGTWINSVTTLPCGDLLKLCSVVDKDGIYYLACIRSEDGGLTWGEKVVIPHSEGVNHHGGFIVDFKAEKLFAVGYYLDLKNEKSCTPCIFMSPDNGYTWEGPITLSGDNIPPYLLSYSNGITLRDADGEGPNVDYVFTFGNCWDLSVASFCDTAIYSRDGGKTWFVSDNSVNYEFAGASSNTFEGGMSEETLFEQADGTLILYARCEFATVKHFAIAKSYDHGITWVAPNADGLSNVYATNTQPIIEVLNGTPVLMWGGQNAFGAKSHYRMPLSMMRSYDDAESFHYHVDASFQDLIASVKHSVIGNLHTNPDMTFCKYKGQDMCYLVSTHHQLYIINVEEFLCKTKGAFDSFEDGFEAEGWLCESGKIKVGKMGATDGGYALVIEGRANPSRSLHHLERGYLELDLFAESFGDHVSVELQTAYLDREGGAAPIRLTADGDGSLYAYTAEGTADEARKPLGLSLCKGQNTVRFDFDCASERATVTVNGKNADMPYIGGIGDTVTYLTLFSTTGAVIAVDKLIAVED